MITQTTNLNLIPGTVLPRINVVQYDTGSRTLEFAIFNGTQRFTLTSAMTAEIQGTKPDRLGFSYSATVDDTNNIIVANLTQQMTAAKGEALCEIVLKNGAERIGTLNFVMSIQAAALNDDTVVSDSELPGIIAEATEQMEAAAASATLAESYAKGGTSSRTGEDTDNAKYYKEQAANSATSAGSSASSAEANALKAEGFAVGEQNGTAVTSGSPYYHNNAEYYAQDAASSAASAAAWSANPPYIGANGDWYVYDTSTEQYVDSGVDASITVDVADITMLPAGSTPYVTNTGTNTDPVFHLFIPKGDTGETGQTGPQGPAATINIGTVQTGAAGSSATVTNSGTSSAAVFDFSIPQGIQGNTGPTGNGIDNIAKTGTSGLVDTYTVTYTDGNTDTFTVTNGRDGTGSGDMSKADYDPSDAVYNAGGIPSYVTAQIEGLDVSDTAVAGSYVTAVSETDGEISVTREAADVTPTSGSTKMLTSGGAYSALADKANTADLATVATSGAYSDLSGTPNLAAVATSGAYSDLSGTPSLATVATSGDYDDLLDKPTLGTAAAKNSTNAVTQNSTDLVESGAVYSELSSVKEALTDEEITRAKNGAHNVLPFNLDAIKAANTLGTWSYNQYTFSGITFNIEASSGKLSLSGTADATYGSSIDYSGEYIKIPSGDYIISKETVNDGISFYLMKYNGDTWVEDFILSPSESEKSITIDYSNYTQFKISIRVSASTVLSTPVTVKPMIRLVTDSVPDYTPYAPTNQELAGVIPTMTKNGAHNLLELDLNTIKSLNSTLTWNGNVATLTDGTNTVTLTVNDDLSITINGTNPAWRSFILQNNLSSHFAQKTGNFKLSSGNILSNMYLTIAKTVGQTEENFVAVDNSDEVDFTLSTDITLSKIYIQFGATRTFTNFTIYPMIRLASDLSSDYTPYAMTNRELTENVNDLNDYKSYRAAKSVGFTTEQYTATIANAKKIFAGYRKPILCWCIGQNGSNTKVWITFTGHTDTWEPSIINIQNAGNVTVTMDGDNLVFNNVSDWGYGVAIGL